MFPFRTKLPWPPAGVLKGTDRSRVWTGEITIPEFGGRFRLFVWGVPRPTHEQSEMLTTILRLASRLRVEATPGLHEDFVRTREWVAHQLRGSEAKAYFEKAFAPLSAPADVWSLLHPNMIEVSPPDERDGIPGVFISIGFRARWEEEHLVRIGTFAGRFEEVYQE